MGIAVPMLDQCCCGCQLRTGTKFVGWCGVIFGMLICILFLVAAFNIETVANHDKGDAKFTPEELKVIKIISIIFAVIYLKKALFCVFLLIGVYQEKIGYYLPWLMYATVSLVIETITTISLTTHETFGSIIGTIIGFCITVYFILVVYSDYRQQEQRGRRGP